MHIDKALRFLLFLLFLTMLVGALKLLNWLPSIIEKGTLEKHASVEELRSRFPNEKIYLPSYFPRNLEWPPLRIVAQRKPYVAIMMYFSDRNTGKVGLSLQQLSAGISPPPPSEMRIARPVRKSSVLIREREGTLVTALCEESVPCYQISWREGNFTLTLTTTVSQRDLIRMATSMVP
ncbi:MAG: hypothetical protein K8I29_18240 [Alphaproteobacteria bacterium]|uniref:DUF4367 domain-containing protein n=1 Tax=Candidatus Nitrobium versatile TaxID=2884831 RepID=A0A953SEV6_9BACT|nr:hypothetical protein [Candidatus Nitrobium versatile]